MPTELFDPGKDKLTGTKEEQRNTDEKLFFAKGLSLWKSIINIRRAVPAEPR